MAYSITHLMGDMERDPPLSAIDALIVELDHADAEHGDVSVSDEEGRTIVAYRNGSVVWEHLEGAEEPRHLVGVSRAEVHRLMVAVATGDMAGVEQVEWRPGYPHRGG